MRVTFGLAGMAPVGVCAASLTADEAVPTVRTPETSMTGSAPAGMVKAPAAAKAAGAPEKPAAVNGLLYAVIAPTYLGQGGTNSFIRLFNGGSTAATITIT